MWPETYIIDRQGIIRRKIVGDPDWSDPEIRAFLKSLVVAPDAIVPATGQTVLSAVEAWKTAFGILRAGSCKHPRLAIIPL